MEGLTTVKISDLEEIFNEIKTLRKEIKELKENEESTIAYSLEQAAQRLNLNYNSIRRLVIKKKIYAKYLNETHGKCVIPFWALKEYLAQQPQK